MSYYSVLEILCLPYCFHFLLFVDLKICADRLTLHATHKLLIDSQFAIHRVAVLQLASRKLVDSSHVSCKFLGWKFVSLWPNNLLIWLVTHTFSTQKLANERLAF